MKQTYQDFEIIIVDDASPENSFEKIKNLTAENPKVKVFKNDINKGVGFTKRKCAELATGDICGFIDPDDVLKEMALETAIKNFDDDKISAVYSQLILCDGDLNPDKVFPKSAQVKCGDPLFFNIHFEMNHFFAFRKSAYDKTIGINPELTSAVDQDLYLKIYDTGNVKFVPEPNYLYRIHGKGVSQEKSKKDKLNANWEIVIRDTIKRRELKKLYGQPVTSIENTIAFIFKKQNSFFQKIKNKLIK